AWQVGPQLMPVGFDVTVPAPLPVLFTASVNRCSVKPAITVVAAVIVVVQVPVPLQPPPVQPVNVEPAAGAAVNVTAWPKSESAWQVGLQLMPVGFDVTVPAPLPFFVMLSVNCCSVNVAVTVVAAVIVVVQAAVPVQPPPVQPMNVEPVAGAAVNVTA